MGCVMKMVDPDLIGVSGGLEEILVAENPITKIGHKKSSETKTPSVVLDPSLQIAYCDCPGFKDTKGKAVEIYNAFSIVDIMEKSKGLSGFLVFINYHALKNNRGQDIQDDIKFLQLLIKDFKRFEQNILFVVTQAPSTAKLTESRKR